MEKFKAPPDSLPIIVIDPDDNPCGQALGPLLQRLVLLKLDFSDDTQNNPKPKTVAPASGSNIDSDHVILMEKFIALATKIDFEFLKIKKELKEMRDGRRNNHASDYYMNDDTPMCDPMEANYVQ
ncbi:hypothetical protein Tco_0783123 [Tanacetum coccineum]